MKKDFTKIGVLTSGGDAPGMNAAIRAIVILMPYLLRVAGRGTAAPGSERVPVQAPAVPACGQRQRTYVYWPHAQRISMTALAESRSMMRACGCPWAGCAAAWAAAGRPGEPAAAGPAGRTWFFFSTALAGGLTLRDLRPAPAGRLVVRPASGTVKRRALAHV